MDSDDRDAFAKQNANLNEQVKLLVRTEKSLFQTRRNLELQLNRIRQLNSFALAASQTSSPAENVSRSPWICG